MENRKSFHCQVAHISIPLGQPVPDNDDAGRILLLFYSLTVVLLYCFPFLKRILSVQQQQQRITDYEWCVANANDIDLKLSAHRMVIDNNKGHTVHTHRLHICCF